MLVSKIRLKIKIVVVTVVIEIVVAVEIIVVTIILIFKMMPSEQLCFDLEERYSQVAPLLNIVNPWHVMASCPPRRMVQG